MSKLINGTMPFKLGSLRANVLGGPFRNFEEVARSNKKGWAGVCMAEELCYLPHTISVPTRDFSVPSMRSLKMGLMKGLAQIAAGKGIYVGCMGGIGRTGLYLAGLAKIMGVDDPVAYVRSHYIPHAVETAEQQEMIADLDVEDLRKWAKFL